MSTSQLNYSPTSPAWLPLNDAPAFALFSDQGSLVAQRTGAALQPGSAHSLSRRVANFFAAHSIGPRLLIGALPFDREQPDALFQPLHVVRSSTPPQTWNARHDCLQPSGDSRSHWTITAQPTPSEYSSAVTRAVARILDISSEDAAPRKVVLSRSLLLRSTSPVDPQQLAKRLAHDRSVTTFIVQLPRMTDGTARSLVGATPELLVSKTGARVISHPLAGSAKRLRSIAEDQRTARALLASEKDQREHRAVVEAILDTLSPYCASLSSPAGPRLRSTATMWHLGTRIEGELKDPQTPCVALAAALHPTPAVCGTPRDWAERAIRSLETVDRGFYAGAVGWTDAQGDGAWYVSIRCAEVAGCDVRLYAGAGIVAGSDPAAETRETAAKFGALLHALEVDDSTLRSFLEGE